MYICIYIYYYVDMQIHSHAPTPSSGRASNPTSTKIAPLAICISYLYLCARPTPSSIGTRVPSQSTKTFYA